ncbi:MAG: TolC family outer membrane protein [Betaproteobacteria bacterium]|nr:TolC family outer membrane protein [Betaproteobacteria bacterium]
MRSLLPAVTVTALAIACAPAGAQMLDIAQAYKDALANDAVVASSRAQLAAVRERVPQARAGLLPTVTGTGALSRQVVDTNLAPRREFNTQNYQISLNQPLYRLQNVEAFEQSKLQVAAAEAQVAQAQLDLILRVSQAYFDVLAAQDSVATIRAQKRAISEQLASAKRNFEVGTATITDQQEAQSRFDLAVAQEYAALNDLSVRRAALAQLVGKPVSGLQVLRPGVALSPPQPEEESRWTENARQNSLLVQQSRVSVEVARREIDRQRYGHRPTLDAVGSVGYSRSPTASFIGVNSASGSLGLQLSIPLYAGGAIDARVREALQLRDKAEADLENTRRQVEQSARQAFLGVRSGLAQVQALQAAEKSSQLALDSNLLGYQVGVRINIDVLNAQQQVFNTQRDLAKARYDVLMNGLRLKSAASALSDADLQALAALMQAPDGDPTEPPPAPSAAAAPGGAGSGAAGAQVTPVAPRSR